ncbi:transposase, partial [Microbacterium lacticum]|uniref:DDE-type integrase/transposase/recombinase n=1 Tax=Microbacterium lacticum TaxID=33885 RepID=UPI0018B079F6
MTDYRFVMGLLLQGYAYRQIEAMAGCSHRAIARARRVLDEEGFTTREQVDGLSLEDVDRLFTDGRKSVVDEFVPVDIERVVAARLGRNKPPLKVLWARYLETDTTPGARFYGYERFCQIVAEHVRVNDLTLPIAHVPGYSMQVDWAGTQMQLTDPITRETTRVSVFVASLPFSGMVFAYGCLDEKQPAWLDAHRRAFEHFGGVTQVVIPDNASTASNQISRTERARDVNSVYAEFLEYYATAAVPTRSYRPRSAIRSPRPCYRITTSALPEAPAKHSVPSPPGAWVCVPAASSPPPAPSPRRALGEVCVVLGLAGRVDRVKSRFRCREPGAAAGAVAEIGGDLVT